MSENTTAHSPDVVLVRRAFEDKSVRHAPWIFLAMMIVAALMLLALSLKAMPDGVDLWKETGKFFSENPGKLWEWFALLIVIAAHTLMPYVQSKDKIVISAAGIVYQTSIPSWFPEIINGWVLPWSRIKKAEIRLPLGLLNPTLLLSDGLRIRKILINAWAIKGEEKQKKKPSIRDIFRFQHTPRPPSFEEMKTRIEASPLIQALRAHNVSIEYPRKAATWLMFDLQSSPRTNVVMIVFLGLLAYALIDTLYLDEIYAGDNPWAIWAGAGLIAGILAQRWIAGPKIPRVVSIGLAAMLGLSMAAALYPGLLRLNQLTDSTGLVAHEYVLHAHVRLVPVENDLPEVTFTRYQDYWNQFPLGSSHRLYLRRGGLGFYQLDEAPVIEAVRAYHEKKNSEARKPESAYQNETMQPPTTALTPSPLPQGEGFQVLLPPGEGWG